MPKLPKLSGTELIRILEQNGYIQMRTKGSHARLYPPTHSVGQKKVTVPLHKELKVGTLLNIMKDAQLTLEDFK
jgi:predicted RNA binding protein YcfA (HicA-like mRNA interferase family)